MPRHHKLTYLLDDNPLPIRVPPARIMEILPFTADRRLRSSVSGYLHTSHLRGSPPHHAPTPPYHSTAISTYQCALHTGTHSTTYHFHHVNTTQQSAYQSTHTRTDNQQPELQRPVCQRHTYIANPRLRSDSDGRGYQQPNKMRAGGTRTSRV